MSDYAIKITVRNGRILRRMRERGIPSVKRLSDLAGVSYQHVAQIVAMRRIVYNESSGEYTHSAQSIAAALHCDPDDLFSDAQRTMKLERNYTETFVDEPTMSMLSAPSAEREVWAQRELAHLMDCLTDRERRVIEGRLEERTLGDIADEERTIAERIRQIEAKAIRKMKQRALSNNSNVACWLTS